MRFPTARGIERLPWLLRALLGCVVAAASVGLTYAIRPLHAFPLLLAFPTVVLSGWFFGMAGSFGCALVDVTLIDLLMTRAQFRFVSGFVNESVRMGIFLVLSTLLGVLMRRLADQKTEIRNRELQERLLLEQAQRQMAEERLSAAEALRKRDELLQLALRANSMGFWFWEIEGNEIFRSDEVYRMAGRQPGTLGAGPDGWLEIVHPDDRQGLRSVMMQSRDQGGDYHHSYRVVWPDKSVHWLETHGKCRFDAEGRLTQIVGVLADVTRRRHAEEAMVRAEKLAVAGRLAASMAHEINNPLEAVTNLLFLVDLSETLDEARAHARSALNELLRVSLITQSALKFHRQAGAPKLTRLSELLESVLAMFRGRLNDAGIGFDLCVDEEIAIACMPSEAQQIFANLAANAVEAMPRGGRLRIRLRPSCDWRGGAVKGMRVTFADTGIGMDRATMQRMYEPFFTTKAETGTGLGMWVVAQLVERHGGGVHAWSSTRTGASGTAISVFLPMEPISPNSAETEAGLGALLRS